ncbi:MAG: ferredoxin [Methanoregula sp.]|nr:ferredoxin [Methanoregula sp.]
MKVSIDRETCVSCGSCWDTCPGFFEQNPDDTFSQVIEKFRLDGKIGEGQPSTELEPCAQDAADLCPVQIISIDNA